MTIRGKKYLYLTVGVGISVVLLWTLFRNINFSKLWLALENANYWWLLPNIALTVFTMYQRAFRWKYMVPPGSNPPYKNLVAATCVGFMANNVLPLRLGEFVRAYSLSTQVKKISKSAALANIFVERMVFDLFALLLIFGGTLWFSSTIRGKLDDEMITAIYSTIGIALLGLITVLILAFKPASVGNRITRYLFFLPDTLKAKIRDIIMRFAQGLEFMSNFSTLMNVVVQTLLIWLLMGISGYFVFLAFGFHLPLDAPFVLLVVVSISILIPSSPGFVGVYHAGAVWTLMAYGISKEDALSCAIVMHAVQFIVVTLLGFYFLKKEHLSLRELEEGAVD
jgi:uncharacterized protein (TIRG00374 family)